MKQKNKQKNNKMEEQKINCLRPVCAATFSNDNSNIGRQERRACVLNHEQHLKKIYCYENPQELFVERDWLKHKIEELKRKKESVGIGTVKKCEREGCLTCTDLITTTTSALLVSQGNCHPLLLNQSGALSLVEIVEILCSDWLAPMSMPKIHMA